MSFDRRLRDELREEATAIEPDVERHLGAVEARARPRGGVGAMTLVLAAAIVFAVLVLRLPGQLATGGPGPSAQPGVGASPAASASTSVSYPQIAGTYQVTLDPTNAAVSKDGVGGTWTMQLLPNGGGVLSLPATFLPGNARQSGIDFSVDGDRFRTSLFYNDYCNSVGNYVWNLAGGRLSFTSVDDTCSIRKTLLGTTPWLKSK